MRAVTQDQFQELCKQAGIRKALYKDVRFNAVANAIDDETWRLSEIVAIPDRTKMKGILLVDCRDTLWCVPYELSQRLVDSSGRAQSVICDFCRTWQTGGNAGRISFQRPGATLRTVSFLCCADLACSRHVRGLTSAARVSRAQLREDITTERRVERLREQLFTIMTDLEASYVAIEG